jgi:cobalt-zinc-cadmium efflux system membrane fusion protein
MKEFILVVGMTALAISCQRSSSEEEGHSHETPPSYAYTVYSGKVELFVEFRPLVVGQSSRFAAHFTRLGELFTSLDEGVITLSLVVNAKGIRTTAEAPSSPGIFRLGLKPVTPGMGTLVFDIKTSDFTDRITIDSVVVFENQEQANQVEFPQPEAGTISFLKEQAWKIEFANEEIQPRLFHEVIKVSGQLTARPSQELVVSARSNGIVRWNDEIVVGTRVRSGQQLFVLTSGNLAQGNIESQYREAKANFEKADADLKRVQPLLADKIVSEKEYAEIKNRLETARIEFETISRNYSQGGQSVTSPMDGFVRTITARSGEFVQAGDPLAIITKEQSLQLQADVPLRYAGQLPLINNAQFKTLHDNEVFDVKELGGKVLSYAKAIGEGSTLLPIFFTLNNNGTLIPGDPVEVYLSSTPIRNALVVPLNSLIEEQGSLYAFVQTAGESFQKRKVTIGAQNGREVQILNGIEPGERVVTRGAFMIKLATQSSSVPAHGHEH